MIVTGDWHCENSAAELLEDIVKNAQPAEMQEVLLLVAQLFASQPQLTSFPDKPLKVCLIGNVSVPLWPGCFQLFCARSCCQHGHDIWTICNLVVCPVKCLSKCEAWWLALSQNSQPTCCSCQNSTSNILRFTTSNRILTLFNVLRAAPGQGVAPGG